MNITQTIKSCCLSPLLSRGAILLTEVKVMGSNFKEEISQLNSEIERMKKLCFRLEQNDRTQKAMIKELNKMVENQKEMIDVLNGHLHPTTE